MKKLLFALGVFAALAGVQAKAQTPEPAPLHTIDHLDLARYMGNWYEIARYPNGFQKQCVADVRAQYRLEANATVTVTNSCLLASGATDTAVGVARTVGAAQSPSLQVRFAPSWLSWLPWVWGDYWVIDLDEGYQLAAVSEPRREYLWILARTPQVSAEAYDALLQRLRAQGLDPDRLVRTRQGG